MFLIIIISLLLDIGKVLMGLCFNRQMFNCELYVYVCGMCAQYAVSVSQVV